MLSTSWRNGSATSWSLDHVDLGAQDRKRGAQLVRRVGGKLALPAKPGIEPVERVVDRAHQRQHLARHAALRQSQLDPLGADLLGQRRGGDDRLDRAAKDDDVDRQQQQQDRRGDPAHPGQEPGDDVVDQDVAMGEILDDLDRNSGVPSTSAVTVTP